MYTALTRAIRRRYGHRTVPRACPECGLREPTLDDFPAANVMGVAALAWATRDRRVILGLTLHCPRCGAAMTLDEERARRNTKRR